MKNVFMIISLVLLPFMCYSQNSLEIEDAKRSYVFDAFLGIGRGTFETNQDAPSKFPTLESRLGIGISKPIFDHFSLKIRPALGIKFKRESYYNLPRVDPGEFWIIDEMASQRSRGFVEVPLLLQYHVQMIPLSFAAGINARQFFFRDRGFDNLSGKSEVGIIAGAYYRVTPGINVGVDYYYGLTTFHSALVGYNNENFTLDVRNNFLQLSLEIGIFR